MNDQDLKLKIKRIAVEHFNTHGYHGTTIRNIANEVGCSLPMVYYYYKSKKDLFHEIIKKDYFDMLGRESRRLKAVGIIDFYTEFLLNVMNMSDYDKKVYRLGIKVYLSFDGDEELLRIMEEWEASIVFRHYTLILPHLKDSVHAEAKVRVLIHLIENIIERMIVKNQYVSEKEIREELSIIMG
ncbi:MAG: TetR/AcrR family transcriptional regulator [Sphaerochaetaceae bacterium]|jgi:AcrR family transcriptional regulator|nr:TetR/AcrR family transcriptional regulator [Sphaerochaetaceae bacterium]MDX9809141.1 TetR/AcrR family transcriptional regulator [Sphaerochaetaceae bacterium]NLV84988.1 TetR/AcrR family transcriptional regulator [Spirochaetales bacterium]